MVCRHQNVDRAEFGILNHIEMGDYQPVYFAVLVNRFLFLGERDGVYHASCHPGSDEAPQNSR